MKELTLTYVGGVIALGLLAWNVTTTQDLTVQIARFEADALNRIQRLEYWTERLADRINKLETKETEE